MKYNSGMRETSCKIWFHYWVWTLMKLFFFSLIQTLFSYDWWFHILSSFIVICVLLRAILFKPQYGLSYDIYVISCNHHLTIKWNIDVSMDILRWSLYVLYPSWNNIMNHSVCKDVLYLYYLLTPYRNVLWSYLNHQSYPPGKIKTWHLFFHSFCVV